MKRRTYLRGSLLAVSAGVAGCGGLSGSGDDDDAENGDGEAHTPDSTDVDYLDWVGEAATAEAGRLEIATTTQSTLRTFEQIDGIDDAELNEDLLGQRVDDIEFDVEVQAAGQGGLIGQYHVILGNVDTDAAIEELESQRGESYEHVGEYDEYDVYESEDNGYALGSTDRALISATNREWLEMAVDAKTGDDEPLSQAAERIAELDSQFDYRDSIFLEFYPELLEDDAEAQEVVGWGVGLDVGEEEITAGYSTMYTDADTAAEVEEDFDPDESPVQILGLAVDSEEIVDITSDGRFITVEATLPTQAVVEPDL